MGTLLLLLLLAPVLIVVAMGYLLYLVAVAVFAGVMVIVEAIQEARRY